MTLKGRITRKVSGTGHVMLTCRNHQTLAWHTKNIAPIGARTIFFAGEGPRGDGSKKYNEFVPPRHAALEMLADGRMVDRKNPIVAETENGFKVGGPVMMENTPENIAWVNEKYDALEAEFLFECSCPVDDLIIDPSYHEMPDVDL